MKTALLSAFFLICLAGSSLAVQGLNCMSSLQEMIEFLQTEYQEGVIFSGVTRGNDYALAMTLNHTGEWSVISTNPQTGEACLIAEGLGGSVFTIPITGQES